MGLTDDIWVASRRKQRISRGHDTTRLSIRGYQVGSVLTLVGESWQVVNIHDLVQTEVQVSAKVYANAQWLKDCLALVLNDLELAEEAAKPIMERFWRTMVLEQPSVIGDAPLDPAEFLNLLHFLDRAASPHSSFVKERAALYEILRSFPQLAPRVVRFIDLLDRTIKNRLLFLAAGSIFPSEVTFGLTHNDVKPGDTICVFEGAKVPHLLRPRDAMSWEFVGEVYVYEVMHGEAEAATGNGKTEPETFVLV